MDGPNADINAPPIAKPSLLPQYSLKSPTMLDILPVIDRSVES
jgi:hypothetical protein